MTHPDLIKVRFPTVVLDVNIVLPSVIISKAFFFFGSKDMLKEAIGLV